MEVEVRIQAVDIKPMGCGRRDCKYNKNLTCGKEELPVVTASAPCPSFREGSNRSGLSIGERRALRDLGKELKRQRLRETWLY